MSLALGHFADVGGVQVPFFENRLDLRLAAFLHDDQHALLAFGEENFVGIHAGLALGDLVQLDVDAGAAARGRLAGGAGQPRRAHVLDADDEAGDGHHFEAGLEQKFFHERVALLDGGAVGGAFGGKFAGGKAGAAEAVAPGGGADVINRIARRRGRRRA